MKNDSFEVHNIGNDIMLEICRCNDLFFVLQLSTIDCYDLLHDLVNQKLESTRSKHDS